MNAGEAAGTQGQGLRLEAVEIKLTGALAEAFDVKYRAHVQDYGDAQGWVSNGQTAGTTGESKRVEEIKVALFSRSSSTEQFGLKYRAYSQDCAWLDYQQDGGVAGVTGSAKRLEALSVDVSGNTYGGAIGCRTYLQDVGWTGWEYDGVTSGSIGCSRRIEALEIKLTGGLADNYDVWYRVHAENHGWLGWTSNGTTTGTVNYALRLEAVQIVLLPKGSAAPGDVGGVTSVTSSTYFYREPVVETVVTVQSDPIKDAMITRAQGYSSRSKYLILIDITNCRGAIFTGSKNNWTCINYFLVAPGKAGHRTPSGTYKILQKCPKFYSYRSWAHYTCKFKGPFYLHSILYDGAGNVLDGRLGEPISHGCIRMDTQIAKWIYETCPVGTTVALYR